VAKKTTKSKSTESELTYEELVDQLETLVDRIESGEIGLEESIKGYEEGIGLVKRARGILDRAEQRIVELNADAIDTDLD
tara:strand:+ start:48546 stop:48785 length:240 start_codon:yes stop_codon:yes gene_type:complete